MLFSIAWHNLVEEADDLPEGATPIMGLSHTRFHVTDVQERRIS